MEADKNLVHEIKAKISRASSYIRKPFLPQELIAKVEQYLPEKARTI
jgi:DNA-binding response OmpR family regulator